uniref:Uncharacterized protein n=1 Tax=Nelumbo nucifera TaxID=4432 RepID=A0A822YER6_NELNU|nr:TPA_asm: hypothetical protein HUJ06_029476 [Nelumbo nucifera]
MIAIPVKREETTSGKGNATELSPYMPFSSTVIFGAKIKAQRHFGPNFNGLVKNK